MHDSYNRTLPRPLLLFVLVLLALAILSCLDAVIGYLQTGRHALDYLWMPYPAFDFVDYTLQFPYLHTPHFFTVAAFPWVYPAPAIFVLYPFYKLAAATTRVFGFAAFALVVVGADLLVAWRFAVALSRGGLARRHITLLLGVTMLFGWPLFFALQRGNVESLLWIGIAAGVVCFANRRYAAAALLFGIIGSVKLYPLLFLALLLRPGRLRYVGLGLLSAAITTLAALRFLEPDIRDASLQISSGIRRWTEITTAIYPPFGIGADHSLLGLLRQCTFGAILRPPHALDVYLGLAAVLTTAAFLLRVRTLPALNQTLFISCAAILLPPTSFDYTLVLVLIPWAWMVLLCVRRAREGQSTRPLTLPLLLFGVVLAPLAFLHTHAAPQVNVEGPVRCVALLALMVFAACVPVRDTELQPHDRVPQQAQASALPVL